MTLTFKTHISSYILPNLRSIAAIVLKYPLFSLFHIEKPKLPNLTLSLNRSGSLEGHYLNKL